MNKYCVFFSMTRELWGFLKQDFNVVNFTLWVLFLLMELALLPLTPLLTLVHTYDYRNMDDDSKRDCIMGKYFLDKGNK